MSASGVHVPWVVAGVGCQLLPRVLPDPGGLLLSKVFFSELVEVGESSKFGRTVGAGSLARLRRRMRRKIAKAMSASAAAPPTTPPIMGAMFVFSSEAAGASVGVTTMVAVETITDGPLVMIVKDSEGLAVALVEVLLAEDLDAVLPGTKVVAVSTSALRPSKLRMLSLTFMPPAMVIARPWVGLQTQRVASSSGLALSTMAV